MEKQKKSFIDWLYREANIKNFAFVIGIVFIFGTASAKVNEAIGQVAENTYKLDCKVEESAFKTYVDETANRFERIEDKLDKILFYLVQKGK